MNANAIVYWNKWTEYVLQTPEFVVLVAHSVSPAPRLLKCAFCKNQGFGFSFRLSMHFMFRECPT